MKKFAIAAILAATILPLSLSTAVADEDDENPLAGLELGLNIPITIQGLYLVTGDIYGAPISLVDADKCMFSCPPLDYTGSTYTDSAVQYGHILSSTNVISEMFSTRVPGTEIGENVEDDTVMESYGRSISSVAIGAQHIDDKTLTVEFTYLDDPDFTHIDDQNSYAAYWTLFGNLEDQ